MLQFALLSKTKKYEPLKEMHIQHLHATMNAHYRKKMKKILFTYLFVNILHPFNREWGAYISFGNECHSSHLTASV